MAVSTTVQLPAAPAGGGSLDYIPLGGNGIVAPHAAYGVKDFTVTADASGGKLAMIIKLDNRFCSLVSWVEVTNAQAISADEEVRMTVKGNLSPSQTLQGQLHADSSVLDNETLAATWSPTPFLYPGGGTDLAEIVVNMRNTNGDVMEVSALIYLFDIRARELAPIQGLLQPGSGYSTNTHP